MATLYANYNFDFGALNLNQLYVSTYDATFWDNYYFNKNGYTYEDSLDLFWNDSGAFGATEFYGHNIVYDAYYGVVHGGTITAIFEHIWNGSYYEEWWGVQGISISAVALQDAMYTSSVADDYALMAAALSGADTFILSNYADRAYGFSGNDMMKGFAGNDLLYGGDGNDTLDGGLGTDRLEGGAGNDTYILATSGDTVVEGSGAGTDLVKAGYSYTLGSNVENLLLTGTSALDGTGNGLANVITGNGSANSLKGMAGNDTLKGLGGNDTLDGVLEPTVWRVGLATTPTSWPPAATPWWRARALARTW